MDISLYFICVLDQVWKITKFSLAGALRGHPIQLPTLNRDQCWFQTGFVKPLYSKVLKTSKEGCAACVFAVSSCLSLSMSLWSIPVSGSTYGSRISGTDSGLEQFSLLYFTFSNHLSRQSPGRFNCKMTQRVDYFRFKYICCHKITCPLSKGSLSPLFILPLVQR